MTKRGAEGLRIVGGKHLHLRKIARGDYVVSDLLRTLGRVKRERHTYRVPYFPGSRIGHDRTHWCWHAAPVPVPGAPAASWCHTTLQAALEALT